MSNTANTTTDQKEEKTQKISIITSKLAKGATQADVEKSLKDNGVSFESIQIINHESLLKTTASQFDEIQAKKSEQE